MNSPDCTSCKRILMCSDAGCPIEVTCKRCSQHWYAYIHVHSLTFNAIGAGPRRIGFYVACQVGIKWNQGKKHSIVTLVPPLSWSCPSCAYAKVPTVLDQGRDHE